MTPQQATTAGIAIASLTLGILGLACIGPFGSIPAVICGHIGWSKIKKSNGALQGEGLAIAGLVTGYIGIALIPVLAAIAIPSFVNARETAQRTACINNVRLIDFAKNEIALKSNYGKGTTIPEQEMSAHLESNVPGLACPKGGNYTVNPVGQEPECSEHGTMSVALQRQ